MHNRKIFVKIEEKKLCQWSFNSFKRIKICVLACYSICHFLQIPFKYIGNWLKGINFAISLSLSLNDIFCFTNRLVFL